MNRKRIIFGIEAVKQSLNEFGPRFPIEGRRGGIGGIPTCVKGRPKATGCNREMLFVNTFIRGEEMIKNRTYGTP